MDVNLFIQIVNGVGFPIAACVAMGAFIVWERKSKQADIISMEQKQNEMLTQVLSTIERNTLVLEELKERIEHQSENKP